MRIKQVLLAITLSAGMLFTTTAAQALTVDEIIELCNAGYSTGDILEFIETLGLDEEIDSEALVRLREEGCDRDLALELAGAYTVEDGEDYDTEEYYYSPHRSTAAIYVHAGWGYPYYSSYYGWDNWYTPWWGRRYTCLDPWYWDYWYCGSNYYYPHRWTPWHDYYYWGRDHDYRRHERNYRYRYVTAHEKAKKSRARGSYRANASRTAVEKSYRAKADSRSGTTAYKKTGTSARSQATYRVKSSTRDGAARGIRKSSRSSSSSSGKSYRTTRSGSARGKSSGRTSRLSGAVNKSKVNTQSRYRTTTSSGTKRSTKSSSSSRSTVKSKGSGSSSKSTSSGGGYRSSSSSSSSTSSSSSGGKSSSSSRSRRR